MPRPVFSLDGFTSTFTLNSGYKIPVFGLGCYLVPVGEDAYANVLEAIKLGYRHIDTAQIYGNEADVGRAVRDSGVPREELFVTSKAWIASGSGYDITKSRFEDSFATLNIGYIDLYLIHSPANKATRLEDWRALEDIVLDGTGRLRSIGVSNYGVHHLEELAAVQRIPPACNQIELHPFLQRPDIVSYCEEKGILIVAYSSLAKGRNHDNATLVSVASHYPGASVPQVMLRWALQHGWVVIPKSSSTKRLLENSQVVQPGSFVITDEDMAALDALDEKLVTGWDPVVMP